MENRFTITNFLWFIHEREAIRTNRELGKPWPWTTNIVLRETKFTNIDRNNDYGTRALFEFVQGKTFASKIFYIVMFRCFYSVRSFFEQMSGDMFVDFRAIKERKFVVGNRLPYQIFLKKGQNINEFLKITAYGVYSSIFEWSPTWKNFSIREATDIIADFFKETHGKRQQFLATEIAKDLSVFFPHKINPNSECYLNIGAKKGLKILGTTIEVLLEKTGLNYSQLEHALCEYSKYVKRTTYYEEHGEFLDCWKYKKSS